jgi:hypothetical protein
MSSIILSANDSPVAQPYDKYWDAPMTRREAHRLFMKLASNDNELMGMADTAAILINFICEKKLAMVDRTEVDSYVAFKTEQLKAQREALATLPETTTQGQATDAITNS